MLFSVAGGRATVAYITDSDLYSQERKNIPNPWSQRLSQTTYARRRLSCGTDLSALRTVSAASMIRASAVGENWCYASSRVSVTVRIETDPTKNGGNPMIGKPVVSVGDTHLMGTPDSMNKKSDGPVMPTATASQDSNGNVTVNLNMNMRDPFQPAGQGAASNVNINVNESATSAGVNGTVSGAPSFEANFTPQGAPTTNLPVQSSPTNTVPFLEGLQQTNHVDKQTDLKQAPQ